VERTKQGEFNWVDLSAGQFEKQGEFYEALFGWSHMDVPFGEGMTYRMFKADGHTVGGMSQLSPDVAAKGQPSAWNIYVAVDDVDATVAEAAELGGAVAIPAMDVPGSGRMAAVEDPTGAHIFFWKPLNPDPSMEYMQPGMLSWNDLSTRDPQKAIDFYSKLLRWDIRPMEGGAMPYWSVSIDGQGEGGIMAMPDMVPAEMPAYWLAYFGTADLPASVERAKALGAAVLSGPMEVPNMVAFAVLADPVGAVFALMQPLMSA
jgi:predicted enzyme related to lactoylglutathione lyase